MSHDAGSSDQQEMTLPQSCFEALRQSPEFRGSVEPVDSHEHANDHFALIYETEEERFRAVVPFVRQGLERGERCLYVIDERSEDRDAVIGALRDGGVSVNDATESGALSFTTVRDTYLRTIL